MFSTAWFEFRYGPSKFVRILKWQSSENGAQPIRTAHRHRWFHHVFRETFLEMLAGIAWLAGLHVVILPHYISPSLSDDGILARLHKARKHT